MKCTSQKTTKGRVTTMNKQELSEKMKTFFGKAGKKTVITVCTVLVLGCAVVLNVILFSGEDASGKKGFAVNLADGGEDGGSADKSAAVEDYFAAMTLSRQQARDEAMEVLLSVAESTTALEEAKQAALGDINKLAAEIEAEANIEMLVQSKGFSQCIAVLNGENCNLIVESSGLLPTEIAQISEIVYEQCGIVPANLKIIEKNEVNIEA